MAAPDQDCSLSTAPALRPSSEMQAAPAVLASRSSRMEAPPARADAVEAPSEVSEKCSLLLPKFRDHSSEV